MEDLELKSEADNRKGRPLPTDAHDAAVHEQALLRSAASKDQALKPPTVLSFLDKPPAAPPRSQVEVHEALPAMLHLVRPSEPTRMEHRVNEAEARLPKWMRREERPARPALDLEAVPTEELQTAGDDRQSRFETQTNAAASEPQESTRAAQREGSKLESALQVPDSQPTALEGQSSVDPMERTEDARGELASAVEQRLERQRMLARERRQKIESRKERISQQRAQELETRRARQEARLWDEMTTPPRKKSGKELGTPPVGGEGLRSDSPLLDVFAANSRERLGGGMSAPPHREASEEPGGQDVALRNRAQALTTLRELQALSDGFRRASPSAATQRDTFAQQGGTFEGRHTPSQATADLKAALAREEERRVAQQTKMLLERLLELQKRGLDSRHVPLSDPLPQAPLERRLPSFPASDPLLGSFQQGGHFPRGATSEREQAPPFERHPGFGMTRASPDVQGRVVGTGSALREGSPRPPVDSLLSALGESLQSRERAEATARGLAVRSALESAREVRHREESLDLSLHLGPPSSPQPSLPRAAPSHAAALVAPRPAPQDVEAVIREHIRRAQASGQAQPADEERGPTDGGSSTAGGAQLSPTLLRSLNVAELLRRGPDGKRKREDVEVRSTSEEGHGGRRWLSAAAAEIEQSVLEELRQGARGGQRGPSYKEDRK